LDNRFFRIGNATFRGIIAVIRKIRNFFLSSRGALAAIRKALFNETTRRGMVIAVICGVFITLILPATAEDYTDSGVRQKRQYYSASDTAANSVHLPQFKALTLAQAAALEGGDFAYASYHGPSVEDFLKDPPYPNFDLEKVFEVAQQYIGVPYRFGGATPAGFDCSGFVMFVYAQFGIALPHDAGAQGAAGQPIQLKDARPGDLVIMAGHDGIYAGAGMILDSPQFGGRVSIRPLWTSDYYIVRLGI